MFSDMSHRCALFIFLCGITFFPITLHAQDNVVTSAKQKENPSRGSLFEGDDILHFKLIGKLNDLFNDRGDNGSYHAILLQYMQKDSNLVSIQIKAKTRGHFRRLKANCKMPPLLLEFPKEQNKNSVFKKQNKLKLVVPCQGDDYVIKEWLVYKIYNLVSEKSFRAKLVQVDFEDSLKQRKTETHYCILLEDEKKMAERSDAFVWKPKMLNMKNTNEIEFRKMAVFQYMIGNTDWGIPFLQNIVLITKDSLMLPVAVPYDFDHAGIVDASYAGPAPELELTSNRERLYRGYCEKDLKSFASTFELFNRLKPDIYNLYTNCSLLNPKYIKFVKNFLDDFYSTINNNRKIESEFGKPCTTNERVEIKGLKK
jgi:hypothetical protein